MSLYPITIIEDRYGGTYSGGSWIAIAESHKDDRLNTVESEGNGDDVSASNFWYDPPSWIGVGNTPDQALAALKAHQDKCSSA